MKHEEFKIGAIFWCGDGKWRCTDIGTRVVTAIRLSETRVAVFNAGAVREETLCESEAKAAGWFNGPPYAVAEHVFNEYDIPSCHLTFESENG